MVGAGGLALWAETEGLGLVQHGEENVADWPNRSSMVSTGR